MKTVDKYLLSNFIKPLFVCVVVFIGLLLFVDSAEKLRPFISYSKSAGEGSWKVILYYIFGSMMVYLSAFLPFVIALSGSVAHVNLNKTGQLRALYSFGLNHHRIFRFPLLLAFGLGLLLFCLNISFLPNMIREVESSSRLMRGLPNKNKAFILEENLTLQDQLIEKKINIIKPLLYPESLNPPIYQIINYGEMVDLTHFKKILITRLDVNRKIRQRFILFNCSIENGFIVGQNGTMQDYYWNGDLYKEENLILKNNWEVKVKNYGVGLVEMIALYDAPNQASFVTLMENYNQKIARDELVKRLILPVKCVLLLLVALALSCLFDLKAIYMCFAVMIFVALIDLFSEALPKLFFANSITVLPALIAPISLYIIAKIVFKKASV